MSEVVWDGVSGREVCVKLCDEKGKEGRGELMWRVSGSGSGSKAKSESESGSEAAAATPLPDSSHPAIDIPSAVPEMGAKPVDHSPHPRPNGGSSSVVVLPVAGLPASEGGASPPIGSETGESSSTSQASPTGDDSARRQSDSSLVVTPSASPPCTVPIAPWPSSDSTRYFSLRMRPCRLSPSDPAECVPHSGQ